MPKIVSKFSWIFEIKKLKLRELRRSSIHKRVLKIAMKYNLIGSKTLELYFLELRLKEIVNRDPLSTNMGSTFCKRLEEKDLVKK
jgi:hypothetical protein